MRRYTHEGQSHELKYDPHEIEDQEVRLRGRLARMKNESVLSEEFGMVGMGKMWMSHGALIDLFQPSMEGLTIEMLAYGLAGIYRFTGQTRYTVAQHSVFVSKRCPVKHALAGLLHDPAEALLGDIARPMKNLPQMAWYRELERLWRECILEWAGLPLELPDVVKLVDNRALLTEFRDLFPSIPEEILSIGVEPYPETIVPLPPDEAQRLFLERYELLTDRMNRVLVRKVEPVGETKDADSGPWWMPWAGRTLVLCGGTCGQKMLLDHEIGADGEVNPSVDCPNCDWHVWVTLEGWVAP